MASGYTGRDRLPRVGLGLADCSHRSPYRDGSLRRDDRDHRHAFARLGDEGFFDYRRGPATSPLETDWLCDGRRVRFLALDCEGGTVLLRPILLDEDNIIVAGGVHALVFHRSVYGNTVALDRAPKVPTRAKVAACISLFLWIGAVTCGLRNALGIVRSIPEDTL